MRNTHNWTNNNYDGSVLGASASSSSLLVSLSSPRSLMSLVSLSKESAVEGVSLACGTTGGSLLSRVVGVDAIRAALVGRGSTRFFDDDDDRHIASRSLRFGCGARAE